MLVHQGEAVLIVLEAWSAIAFMDAINGVLFASIFDCLKVLDMDCFVNWMALCS